MIEARNLTKRYGHFVAVDRANFEVQKGRVVGFLGLNGAGKTTTLRMISCFLPPSSGGVQVAGLDTVADSEGVRAKIGYLPERVPLYDDLTVAEYLRFRARIKGLRGSKVRERLEFVSSRMGLKDRERQLIGTLSKGYRQRVGFADALIHNPALLVLDEPTSGLDPDQRIEMRRLIAELGSEHTVLLSTHILSEAEAVCDDIIIIHRGRICANRSLKDLKAGLGQETMLRFLAPKGGEAEVLEETFATRELAEERLKDLLSQGAKILEFRPMAARLEDIFIALTTGRETAR